MKIRAFFCARNALWKVADAENLIRPVHSHLVAGADCSDRTTTALDVNADAIADSTARFAFNTTAIP
ncbi:hypothetical protein [Actinoplanes aureus]|uniref:Uncharacterized protein n=1 Tax=Actinoplanes aureus TaxID=2792083 RepID=A0A931CIN0_9ACTN|nr:hypothetical protein [Actinoplanes aureus]MBG0568028.1 hypothetical protein [Actinoplanes aureus]